MLNPARVHPQDDFFLEGRSSDLVVLHVLKDEARFHIIHCPVCGECTRMPAEDGGFALDGCGQALALVGHLLDAGFQVGPRELDDDE